MFSHISIKIFKISFQFEQIGSSHQSRHRVIDGSTIFVIDVICLFIFLFFLNLLGSSIEIEWEEGGFLSGAIIFPEFLRKKNYFLPFDTKPYLRSRCACSVKIIFGKIDSGVISRKIDRHIFWIKFFRYRFCGIEFLFMNFC